MSDCTHPILNKHAQLVDLLYSDYHPTVQRWLQVFHVFLRFQKPTGKPLAKKEEKPSEPKEEIPAQEAVEQK